MATFVMIDFLHVKLFIVNTHKRLLESRLLDANGCTCIHYLSVLLQHGYFIKRKRPICSSESWHCLHVESCNLKGQWQILTDLSGFGDADEIGCSSRKRARKESRLFDLNMPAEGH